LLAAALACAASGCSLRILRPAPPRSEWPEPVLPSSTEEKCTTTLAPVVGDAAFGTIFSGLSYVERNSGAPKLAFAIGTAAIPMFISAVYGAITVSRCRAYTTRFRDAQAGGFAAGLGPRASDLGTELGLRAPNLELR
jgi:hypothetical protein